MLTFAEYIWLDGAQPTQQLRSKTRVVSTPDGQAPSLADLPDWGFDGSSTYQAEGGDSDLILKPVRVIADPVRGGKNVLVMTEVLNPDGTPHASNERALLAAVMEAGAAVTDPWIGFEQEYTLFQGNKPLGWPEGGYPAAQGPFYCGVGSNNAFGRALVEAHLLACAQAGITIYGINAEVMPGQWEFQVGYRGIQGESADPLTVSDHLWLSRWLLQRLGEDHGVEVSFDNKPVKGDWNGAGAHTNFSTREMRAAGGLGAIEDAIAALGRRHQVHVEAYGAGLADRLTGLHETCSIEEFKGGVADRGASIRIPRQVANAGHGYLEDRRPGANCNPYTVSRLILETVCDLRVGTALAASA
ncbi:MAG: glutamine synthetase beta-grasp domain-containing protein [Planctomycetota bacterium]